MNKDYVRRMVKEGWLHFIKGKFNVEMSNAELDSKSNNDKTPTTSYLIGVIERNIFTQVLAAG
jgi:hypothetical protein